MARIQITQWRKFGDDDDSLWVTLLEDEEEDDVPERIAAFRGLKYDPDSAKDDNTLIIIIDKVTFHDGMRLTSRQGKVYKLSLTPVEEIRESI